MPTRLRVFLLAFVGACLLAGGGVLHLIANDPMSYRAANGGFDYQYAITTALMGGAFLGPMFFILGLVLYGLGCAIVQGVQLLFQRK